MDYSKKTYDELVKEESRLDDEYEKISDECAKEGLSYQEFSIKAKPVKEKLYFISKYLRLKKTPSVEYGKEWKGDLYELETFISRVRNGGFIDDDGWGYYATETTKSDIEVYPSDIKEGLYRNDFTHVIWINR